MKNFFLAIFVLNIFSQVYDDPLDSSGYELAAFYNPMSYKNNRKDSKALHRLEDHYRFNKNKISEKKYGLGETLLSRND